MADAIPQLRTAAPEAVGLSTPELERAAGHLAQAVSAGQATAAAILVARQRTVVLSRGYGHLRPEAGSPAVDADSTFLLASITKPVTALAALRLVDAGLLSLDDPVNLHIPEYRGRDRALVKVRHLLSHTSGMPDMLPQNVDLRRAHAPLSEFVRGAIDTPLLHEPGAAFSYQSKGILLAAEIVERLTGMRLRDFERDEIFQPLGMAHSALGLGHLDLEDLVWCGTSMEETADAQRWGANTPYWRDMGCPWGGMHSNVGDLAVLLQTMLDGGGWGGHQLLSPAAVTAMTTDQNGPLHAPWGLGWALRDSRVWSYFGELVSPGTFGHVGATGTVAWADPERQLICVILTNQMVQGGHLLRRVSNAVTAAVVA